MVRNIFIYIAWWMFHSGECKKLSNWERQPVNRLKARPNGNNYVLHFLSFFFIFFSLFFIFFQFSSFSFIFFSFQNMSSFSPNFLYSYICLHFLLLYPFQYEKMNLNALYFSNWSKCWPIWLCHQTRPPPSIEIRLSPTQLTVDRPHSLLSNQQQKYWTTINNHKNNHQQ